MVGDIVIVASGDITAVDGIVLKRDFPFAILTTIIVLLISCGSVLFGGHFIGYSVD